MQNEQYYKDIVIDLIQKHPFSYFNIIKKQLDIYNFLIEKYPQLKTHPISEYCYWLIHDLTDFPRCIKIDKYGHTCNNIPKFISFKHGYKSYCSLSCMQNDIKIQNLKKQTNLKKFNCEWPVQAQIIKNKIKQTIKNNENKDPDYRKKITEKLYKTYEKKLQEDPNFWIEREQKSRKTKIQNGSDPTWNNREKFKKTLSNFTEQQKIDRKNKLLKTFEDKLDKNPEYWKERYKKVEQTNIENGKDPHWHNVDQMLQTKEKRYGDKYYRNTQKAKNTCLNKYGVNSYSQTHEFAKRRRKHIYLDKYGIAFDSKWELLVFEYCKNNGLNVEYNPKIQFEYEFKNKKHIYKPDFLINNVLYEVKGDHFFKDGKMICPFRKKAWSDAQYNENCDLYEAKHQCMIRNNVIILKNYEINNLNEVFKNDKDSR